MTLNFPSSPTSGQTYSLANGATYTWDGEKWKASNIPDSSDVVQTTDTPANGEFLKWDNGAAVWAAGGGIANVSDDTSPSLGGNLDVGNFDITSTTFAGVISLKPGSSGYVSVWNKKIKDLADPTANQDAATKYYVDNNAGVPASGGSFTGTVDFDGNVTQDVQTVSALNIDCSTGNYFTKTISANSTFTVSNVPSSGTAYSFTLELTHTSGTVTWWTGLEWPGGTAPTLTAGKTHLFVFVTDDGGTRWRGASLVDYAN